MTGDRTVARPYATQPSGPGRLVSLLSDSGMPIEAISRLVGHRNTSVTETVYRKQLRPVLLEGAEAMDELFPE